MNLPMEVDALLEQHYPELSNETLALVLAARASGLDKASLLKALSSEGQAVYIKKDQRSVEGKS